jgi:hypothetical protein
MMDEQTLRSYKMALKEVARSRTAITYCLSNLNVPLQVTNKGVYDEIIKLAQLSGDSTNEVMCKIILALLNRAEESEEKIILQKQQPGRVIGNEEYKALMSEDEIGVLKQAQKILGEVIEFAATVV